ncbi:MAG: sugar phosphate isomerase/epimerase, partial [Candidatus Hydrogenedentota bacterium]
MMSTAQPTKTRRTVYVFLVVGLAWGTFSMSQAAEAARPRVFARENLVAWCVVPFDANKRGPEGRAAMLKRLGFTKLAYDWRAEHVPEFEAEIKA